MSMTFRPYLPDQMLLLPADLRKLEEDVAFRVLGAGNFPQHRMLCEFRRRHLSDFKELFIEVVRLAQELGLARFGKLSLEAQQRAADDARGRQPDQDRNPQGGQPYKRSYGEPDAKAQSNFTDPESGIMKTSNDGFQQCYNAQVAVDGAHQLVVATEVTANASDQGGVPALLDAVAETVGEQPETVLADAGYSNERDLAKVRGEWDLVCLAPDAKRLHPLMAA